MKHTSLIIAIALIVGGVAVFALLLLGRGDEEGTVRVSGLPGPSSEAAALAPGSVPSVAASNAPVVRLAVGRLGIDAPVVELGVLPGGIMESPHTPTDVGWYRFSALPGTGSNAVFAGHVDYVNHGPAVFYLLEELRIGDAIDVALEDGTLYGYKVVSSDVYDANNAPVQEVVGPTEVDTITLITCTGVFNREVLDYDKRLVVRAVRSNALLNQ